MSEQELRVHAVAMGWCFVKHRLLQCGGYWRSVSGECFYALEVEAKCGKKFKGRVK